MVIRNKVFQWRITFNLDLTKQVQKVIVCRKTKKLLHSSISFNNIPLKNSMSQKHLRLTLDVKLNFVEHKKKSLKKLVNIWACCVDFDQLHQYHYYWLSISCLPEVFLGKGVRKICSKFTGEYPCQSAIWNKVTLKATHSK